MPTTCLGMPDLIPSFMNEIQFMIFQSNFYFQSSEWSAFEIKSDERNGLCSDKSASFKRTTRWNQFYSRNISGYLVSLTLFVRLTLKLIHNGTLCTSHIHVLLFALWLTSKISRKCLHELIRLKMQNIK